MRRNRELRDPQSCSTSYPSEDLRNRRQLDIQPLRGLLEAQELVLLCSRVLEELDQLWEEDTFAWVPET